MPLVFLSLAALQKACNAQVVIAIVQTQIPVLTARAIDPLIPRQCRNACHDALFIDFDISLLSAINESQLTPRPSSQISCSNHDHSIHDA